MTQPETFRCAVASLTDLRVRPEVEMRPMRPPQRLAPFSAAWSAEVADAADTAPAGPLGAVPDDGSGPPDGAAGPEPADVLVTGRLVLLHDPEGQDAWDGTLRVVTFVRAELDPEHAGDPMLPEVAWSWLTGALEESGARWTALGGTVTQTSSVRFGDISGPGHACDLELRASWTPTEEVLTTHGEAFAAVLATAAGLPPVGVATLASRRLGRLG